jgi:hypothetical protein
MTARHKTLRYTVRQNNLQTDGRPEVTYTAECNGYVYASSTADRAVTGAINLAADHGRLDLPGKLTVVKNQITLG